MKPKTQTLSAAGTTDPMIVNYRTTPVDIGLFADFTTGTGVGTVTIEHTESDPFATYATDFATDARWRATTSLTAVTADAEGSISFPIRAVRMNVTAFTSGSIDFTTIQSNG